MHRNEERRYSRLVGERDERRWDFEAESPSKFLRLMLGLDRLLSGQVHRLLDQLAAKTSVFGVGYRSRLL